jgi:bifunctional UDP-N-acetylglucosamine pyrophosphorylase/glucosamine-1-phosphate N-acetyltransferase
MIGILLAAGRGTRMKSESPKVLFDLNDEPLMFGPFRALMQCCDTVVVVVGYRGELVKDVLTQRALEIYTDTEFQKKCRFVTQDPPSGTGDAVRVAIEALSKSATDLQDRVLIVNGDLPLVRLSTLTNFIKAVDHMKAHSACLTLAARNPKGLGRILRDERGVFSGIREEKDASPFERRIREVNGGIYCFDSKYLKSKILTLKSNNQAAEFYLTDLLGNTSDRAHRSEAIMARNSLDLLGVNTTYELAHARKVAQARLQKRLCEDHGIDFLDPDSALISARAQFSGPARIGPNVRILGRCKFGSGLEIEGSSLIDRSEIADGAKILWGSVIRESKLGPDSSVGPMAHLRPGTELERAVKIGNFVELKKTKMGAGSKASHLSYIGDASVGDESNIGCGTITCNFDGINKHRTVIGKRAFIGSDSQLIAPVVVGDGAYVGSGTTVTQDVPAGALALSRAELVIKAGYAEKLSQKLSSKKQKS